MRFSRKAATPSRPSSEARAAAMVRAVAMTSVVDVRRGDLGDQPLARACGLRAAGEQRGE